MYHRLSGLNNYFLTVLEVQDQGVSTVSFWRGISSWLVDSLLLTVFSDGGEDREQAVIFHFRAPILSWGSTSFKPNYLKAPNANINTIGIRSLTCYQFTTFTNRKSDNGFKWSSKYYETNKSICFQTIPVESFPFTSSYNYLIQQNNLTTNLITITSWSNLFKSQ